MYIASEPLVRDIARTAQNVVQELERQICFDEYIAMPSFGANIILRFRYTGTAPVNLALLNAMETKMRKAAGARYLVNLDGAAYKACGLIYDRLPATLKATAASTQMGWKTTGNAFAACFSFHPIPLCGKSRQMGTASLRWR